MSNMTRARELMDKARAKRRRGMELFDEADELDAEARKLTFREPSVRRAREVETDITDEMREKIAILARNRSLTMHDIARRVGLRNGGRVSEILNGKR
jgi:ATP phosphoribosyltransferase regulatory subunit HisZ